EIIGTVAGYIGDQIKNAFNTIKVVIEFVMPFVVEIIRTVWDSIKVIITGALGVLWALLRYSVAYSLATFPRCVMALFRYLKALLRLFGDLLRIRLSEES